MISDISAARVAEGRIRGNLVANKLLVAVDGSETGKRVINYAVASIRATTTSIILAYIIEWSPYNILTPREVAERQQKRESEEAGVEESILEPEANELRAQGVNVETVVRHGNIGETLSEIARDFDVSTTRKPGRNPGRNGHCGFLSGTGGNPATAGSDR